MRGRRLAVLALPLWLASCALLGPAEGGRGSGPARVVSPAATTLRAEAGASAGPRSVTVTLTLHNPGPRPAELRYGAQVNWGECVPPPAVALGREDGSPVPAPAAGGRLTCPELQLSRTLPPGEALTLRRTLPPLPPGAYRLTAWFDGEVDGEPARVGAPPVALEVR